MALKRGRSDQDDFAAKFARVDQASFLQPPSGDRPRPSSSRLSRLSVPYGAVQCQWCGTTVGRGRLETHRNVCSHDPTKVAQRERSVRNATARRKSLARPRRETVGRSPPPPWSPPRPNHSPMPPSPSTPRLGVPPRDPVPCPVPVLPLDLGVRDSLPRISDWVPPSPPPGLGSVPSELGSRTPAMETPVIEASTPVLETTVRTPVIASPPQGAAVPTLVVTPVGLPRMGTDTPGSTPTHQPPPEHRQPQEPKVSEPAQISRHPAATFLQRARMRRKVANQQVATALVVAVAAAVGSVSHDAPTN